MNQNEDSTFVVIDGSGLNKLIQSMQRSGYSVIGPTLREDAIVYDEIHSATDLPQGWTDVQAPGRYTLERREDDALFGYNVGPHTWKRYLFPPREKLWQLTIRGDRFEPNEAASVDKPMAFLGVRACELAAMQIQDKVFIEQEYRNEGYMNRRSQALIIAVNCGEAGETCFCESMETGPRVGSGFDLALTELLGPSGHTFLVEVGTERGQALMADTPHRAAMQRDHADAEKAIDRAREQMGRSLQTDGLPELLARNLEHPIWEQVAHRCLSCANCTLVCPTCFCSSLEDTSDLTGDVAERWRQWESCFNGDFSYVHGGNVRSTTASRYRQWMTHKLSTWHDQFGTSGCVGCGRCITWCPVGIDLTEEAAAIHERDGEPMK